MWRLVLLLPAVALLTGCTILAEDPVPRPSASTGAESSGWEQFPHCPEGPQTDWVLVDGFPAAELEGAGIVPDCGDTWARDNGEHFVNVTALEATEEQLDDLGEWLERSGYVELFDDFVPALPGPPAALAGARDFYLDGVHDGDFTRVAIEIYSNGVDPQTYTAFIDYLSPETRALPD